MKTKPMTKAQLRALLNFKRGARRPIGGRGGLRIAEALRQRGLIEFEERWVLYRFHIDAWLTDKGREYVSHLQ